MGDMAPFPKPVGRSDSARPVCHEAFKITAPSSTCQHVPPRDKKICRSFSARGPPDFAKRWGSPGSPTSRWVSVPSPPSKGRYVRLPRFRWAFAKARFSLPGKFIDRRDPLVVFRLANIPMGHLTRDRESEGARVEPSRSPDPATRSYHANLYSVHLFGRWLYIGVYLLTPGPCESGAPSGRVISTSILSPRNTRGGADPNHLRSDMLRGPPAASAPPSQAG